MTTTRRSFLGAVLACPAIVALRGLLPQPAPVISPSPHAEIFTVPALSDIQAAAAIRDGQQGVSLYYSAEFLGRPDFPDLGDIVSINGGLYRVYAETVGMADKDTGLVTTVSKSREALHIATSIMGSDSWANVGVRLDCSPYCADAYSFECSPYATRGPKYFTLNDRIMSKVQGNI